MGNKNPDIYQKLIEQCRKGDSRSQYRLYKLYSKAMYNIAVRMLANRMDAEDVLQEAFVSAFRKINDYREDATFGAWLRRIVINHCINFMQRSKSLIYGLEVEVMDVKDVKPDGEHFKFPPELIHEEVKSLPEGSRLVLNLYLFEGYKHREISEMLNISESTSKSQYQRAKKLLKEKLMKHEQQL